MNTASRQVIHAPTQWLKPAIHPAYGRLLCGHVRNKGVDIESLFKGNSLTWLELQQQQGFISYSQFQHLLDSAINATQCPWLGLEIGSMVQVSVHGPLGYGALSAPTVKKAFIIVGKALATRITCYRFQLSYDNDQAIITLIEEFDPHSLREFIDVILLGSFLDLLEKTLGYICQGIEVSLPFTPPSWHDLYYEKYNKIKVSFDSDMFKIVFPCHILSEPCLTADDFSYRNALRECDQLLASQLFNKNLSAKILNTLFDAVKSDDVKFPSLDEMAQSYNMSTRTLMRKLKNEHSSYQNLVDEVRKEIACWYLQHTTLSIDIIADKLGFQDNSNLSRVFKRWQICTPSEFRELNIAK